VTFWLVVIALLLLLQSPFLVIYTRRTTRKDQDRVAQTLIASNENVATQLRADHKETTAALGQIHTLVNSNLAAAQSRELDSMRGMLAAMREVVTLKQDRGIHIADETIGAVQLVEKRIAELARDLVHKQEQTVIADAQGPQ
jgi:ferritin-like metal-binding protein YciE